MQWPRSEWQVLIPDHHPGFIDWRTYEANQDRIAQNTRPGPHKAGGAVREGSALLQGLAACGRCGRRLHTHYRGRSSAPGYHCPGKILVEGRGVYCLNIGGVQIDEAVAQAFIAALEPAKLAATVAAAERLEADRETSLRQWRLGVERASYEASRAERRYRAVDPDNRLVARGLEREWEERLSTLEAAKAELSRREQARPRALSLEERSRLLALGADLAAVWHAATTTPRDRKELLRTLIEEVIVKVERDKAAARLTLRCALEVRCGKTECGFPAPPERGPMPEAGVPEQEGRPARAGHAPERREHVRHPDEPLARRDPDGSQAGVQFRTQRLTLSPEKGVVKPPSHPSRCAQTNENSSEAQ